MNDGGLARDETRHQLLSRTFAGRLITGIEWQAYPDDVITEAIERAHKIADTMLAEEDRRAKTVAASGPVLTDEQAREKNPETPVAESLTMAKELEGYFRALRVAPTGMSGQECAKVRYCHHGVFG